MWAPVTFDNVKADALELFRRVSPVLEALGDRNRQEILLVLGEHQRLNVGQIAARSPLSRPAVSHHLKVLLAAGLVTVEREGTENFYVINAVEKLGDVKALINLVEQLCAMQHQG